MWQMALDYLFYYPLVMATVWMVGAVAYDLRVERHDPPFFEPPPDEPPPASVIIPCFNEEENVRETVLAALALDLREFEVIAVDDGSSDGTAAALDALSAEHHRLRVVHLARNQGKAVALRTGASLASHELLLCIDGDALLDRHAARWLLRHFVADPRVGAVTGNPRIRNRSTLLGRVQVGEFSSMVGMIKRAQQNFGPIFTISGVIGAFRREALRSVGHWSPDMLTEDIDISWKLQRAGWRVVFEPHALVWILTPETVRGLWRQRLRWAMGGAQVFFRNRDVLWHAEQSDLWPLFLEMCASLVWCYLLASVCALWLLGALFPQAIPAVSTPLLPQWSGTVLGSVCLLQFAVGAWLDGRYDTRLGRNGYYMIWYPLVFWVIHFAATVVAYPKVVFRGSGRRARWVSPDRGIKVN
ncbi:MAG: poly-beta-1,6 N-acetyl-D-glucosamine synthase [Gammaproteobacteria bacterium]|nr:poly-beta-1,6 N-acetyl-D-glucosamine synthase [Gammaproteobacteria bacterium]